MYIIVRQYKLIIINYLKQFNYRLTLFYKFKTIRN